jgi:hypothetical protein
MPLKRFNSSPARTIPYRPYAGFEPFRVFVSFTVAESNPAGVRWSGNPTKPFKWRRSS